MNSRRAVGLLIMVFLSIPHQAPALADESSCVACHARLSGALKAPVDLWPSGVHILSDIGCADCHGGDATRMEGAMAPETGFLGRPDAAGSVAICSRCHADPGRAPLYRTHVDSAELYRAGAHGAALAAGRSAPTCSTCHGSHGVPATSDPAAAVHPRNVTALCGQCHGAVRAVTGSAPETGADGSVADAHSRGLLGEGNLQAPHCATCHGGHFTVIPGKRESTQSCGRCHRPVRRLFADSPHGDALTRLGEPGCTHCHDPHAIEPIAMNALSRHFSTSCLDCHRSDSMAVRVGQVMSRELERTLADLDQLGKEVRVLSARGIDTTSLEDLVSEAADWAGRARFISHAVDEHRFRELTAMAKVKMISAWDVADRSRLELRLRRLFLLFVALMAVVTVTLLLLRLKLLEREQKRQLLMDKGGWPKGDAGR